MKSSTDSTDGNPRYTGVAIFLHWIIALGILALIVIGFAMTHAELAPFSKFKLFQLHKSIGVTLMFAVALRILWRLAHRPPPLPAMPPLELAAAKGAHLGLYGLMLALPLSGWALVSASTRNIPTILFGVVPWPHIAFLAELTDKAPAENAFRFLHDKFAWLMLALILLHVAAALRHQFILRDGLLARMSPFGRSTKGQSQ